MKLSTHLLLVALLFALAGCGPEEEERPAVPDNATLAGADYVAGEILVRYREGTVGAAAAGAAPLIAGAVEVEQLRLGGRRQRPRGETTAATSAPEIVLHRLQLPPGLSVPAALDRLREHPGLLYAEPNYIVRRAVAIAPPSDPSFPKQWGLNNTGQALHGDRGPITGTPGVDIGALEAWGIASGDGSKVVAIIDSGLDYNHPDLQENLWNNPGETGLDSLSRDKRSNGVDDDGNGRIDDWRGWNFIANSNAPLDDDIDGHGTHVAGIVGARGNNGIGVAGINWQIQLMPLKFLDSQGNGTIANAVAAIHYAVANGADVINASYTHTNGVILSERDAIAAAGNPGGVLVVAAAGNSGTNNDLSPFYPASYPLDNILAVAATDPNDSRASFSNYGVTSVDLGAPGVNIYSATRQILCSKPGQYDTHYCDDLQGYAYISGTSMAAPMVSGAAALLWNRYPTFSYLDIRNILLGTVDPVPAMSATASGGRLNLGRALTVDLSQIAPAAPSNLSIQQSAGGSVTLAWQDNAGTETNFIVERSANGSYVPLARLPVNSTGYTDSVAPDGRAASYRVKAVTDYSSSSYSNSVTLNVPLLPPSGLVAAADASAIQLGWNDNTSQEERYELERRAAGEPNYTLLFTGGVDSRSYSDANTSLGVAYSYRVRAYNSVSGYSAYSAETTGYRPPPGGGSGGGGCFIATAAWGSPWTREVEALRRFRDRILLPTAPGRLFVAAYYRLSPPLAEALQGHDRIRAAVRSLLTPLVWLADWLAPAAEAMDRVPPTPPSPPPDAVVPGELLVKFRPATPAGEVDRLVAAAGCTILERLPVNAGTVLRLGLPASLDVASAQRHFAALNEVLYAEPNRRVGLGLPGRPTP